MKITSDLLLNYGAPDAYIDYFDEKFKSEAYIDEVLKADVPIDLLHFIAKYWELDPSSKTLYLDRCEVVNSIRVYNSEDIADSENIVDSIHVADSQFIQNCNNIEESHHVYNSFNVKDSHDIWNCDNIESSDKLIACSDIQNSSEVLYSKRITWSQIINSSTDIDESVAIYKSDHMIRAMFCGFCAGLSNSMFCLNHSNANYQIFNKPVEPLIFERTWEELAAHLQDETFNFIRINNAGYYPQQRYISSIRFDLMFKNLSPEFYGWIGTLPNYSEELFLKLFFK